LLHEIKPIVRKVLELVALFGRTTSFCYAKPSDLVHAIREYRKIAEKQPLTLQGSDYAHAVHELNKAIDRADGLLLQ